jgi:hypothetical protein
MFRRGRGVSLLFLVWVLIGIVVAFVRGYITVSLLAGIASALLAILLWPLVLLGIDLRIG